MTLFSCTSRQLDAIKENLENLAKPGFQTTLHEAQDPTAGPTRAQLPFKIEVTAMDHPGIVQKVVHILRHHDVNIESLSTEVTRAPLSGAPIFSLTLEAGIPAEKPIAKVKQELTRLAAEMNMDLIFK